MIFLNPTYFWALLGLAVPLAIHLWSMKEGRTIRVGSIRLLRESDPKKTSSFRLNEIWLLLLRMLVLSLLVLILAEPHLERSSKNSPLTYLVEPSLLSYEEVQLILDTLPADVSIKLLQSEFPDFEKENLQPDYSVPNYWQLVKEMKALPTDSIIVFTNAFISGIKGNRPQLQKNVTWIVLDPGGANREVVQAISKGDEVELTWIESDHKLLKFEKENFSKQSEQLNFSPGKDSISVSSGGEAIQVKIKPVDSLSILIVKNAIFEQEVKYIMASYAAIEDYLGQPVDVEVVKEEDFINSEDYMTVVWLSELPAPKISAKIVIFEEDNLANQLISEGNSAKEFHLTSRLNSENTVEEDLPERLLKLLDLNKQLDEKLPQYDRRVMNLDEFQPISTAGISSERLSATIDIANYLWVLLLILLLLERGVSYYRKQ